MSVSDSVLAELQRLNAVDGPEGQIALALARNIDSARNGMAMQGDSRALREVLTDIREATPVEADSVDKQRARRQATLRSVG